MADSARQKKEEHLADENQSLRQENRTLKVKLAQIEQKREREKRFMDSSALSRTEELGLNPKLIKVLRRAQKPSREMREENEKLKKQVQERTDVLEKLWRAAEEGHVKSRRYDWLAKKKDEAVQALALTNAKLNRANKFLAATAALSFILGICVACFAGLLAGVTTQPATNSTSADP